MSASTLQGTGVYFDNGYESEGLAYILESVMQHQVFFELPLNLDRQGLFQIPRPIEKERVAAGEWIRDIFHRLGATITAPRWSEESLF